MSDNQNNDLGIPKKSFTDISNEFDNILNKQQKINSKTFAANGSESVAVEKSAKKKSRTVSFAFDEQHFRLLKKHFDGKGMITHSIGIRAILLDYMKKNGIIE